MRILLNDEEIGAIPLTNRGDNTDDLNIAKAQLKQVAHAIEAMTTDGYWLEDIVKAILKEAE